MNARPVLVHTLGLRVIVQPLEQVEGHDALGVREGSGVVVGYLAELTVEVGREPRTHEALRWFAIDNAERQYGPHLTKPKAVADLLTALGMVQADATATMDAMFDMEEG